MSQNRPTPKRVIRIVQKPPQMKKGPSEPTERPVRRAGVPSKDEEEEEEDSESMSSSSQLSCSFHQGQESSPHPPSSHPQASFSQPSSSPPPKQPVISPQAAQSQASVRQLFQVIMQHLLDHMPISNRAARLNYLLLQLKEGVGLREIMNKLDKKDLSLIAEHKKVIQIVASNLKSILQKAQYTPFHHANPHKIVLGAYTNMSLDINLAQLRKALAKEDPFTLKEHTKLTSILMDEVMSESIKGLQSNNIKFVNEEDEVMYNRIQGKEIEKLLTYDPFSDFGMEKDSQFDQVSKYGIFCNKKQEEQVSKQGVFNYRLHRTMLVMEKSGLIVPHEDIKLSKNLALFLIKLTDHHVLNVLKTSMKVAQVTSRSGSEPLDEFAYFAPKKEITQEIPQQGSMEYANIGVCKLKYPGLMKMYRQLRSIQLIEEQRLQDNLLPQMLEKFSRGKKRLNKDERIVTEYFTRKQQTSETIAKLKADTEKDQTNRQKTTANRIAVQPRHVKHFIQDHLFYRSHQISWRFNAIY